VDAPPPSYASFATAKSFNFRDLSMKKPQADYFSLRPVRGSSPTASLAADLSQNFHIDQRLVILHYQIPASILIMLQSTTANSAESTLRQWPGWLPGDE
jgi:hypothetical protein